MHPHIFISSTKKDISYCKICSKLSYKGNESNELPINLSHKLNLDPLKIKYKPFSVKTNFNLPNHLRYLELKKKGILKIKNLVTNFGLKSMVLFKAINFMNQIFLEKEISTENIENIASLCVLLVLKYNEFCLPLISEEFITKNENDILYYSHSKNEFFQYDKNKKNDEILKEDKIKHRTNLSGLFHYIKKNVNNYKYWEILCLKSINYDLGKYSSYDYLILFFRLGIFFCKEKVNTLDLLKYCINILDFITNQKRSCDYSQYTLAMSIIKIALENNNFFDKTVFKYIYGVDLSKKKYLKCSNMIKNILNISYNIFNSKNLFFNKQLIINQHLFVKKYLEYYGIKPNNKNTEKKNEEKNNDLINNNLSQNGNLNLELLSNIINKNSIIINNNFINNNININNNNFYFQSSIINNYFNFFNNNFGIYNHNSSLI